MNIIDINQFIERKVLNRPVSLFHEDLEGHAEQLRDEIDGKSVLVIGGAGTIGSSFIRALLKFRPAKLHVVDTNENGLTELTRYLRSKEGQYIPNEYRTYPMNFGDAVFEKLLKNEEGYDIVANFAAHKHVRSEKDHYAIEAMIDNNVFKAKRFLDLLKEYKPTHFFCVSTDKAANPVNVMGASKKLMEETIMAYSRDLKITTARFANVAFSNGSLLDGYIFRLMKKQPISCPADVKRFFVAPDESGQICLLACILGTSGDIFFPKLANEEMIYFKSITEDFFKEMGIKIDYCQSEIEAKQKGVSITDDSAYPIYFFETDTSGEKLYEEFYTATDEVDLNSYDSMGVVKNANKPTYQQIEGAISQLQLLMNDSACDKAAIVDLLKQFIPDFAHIETGKNLDQKM